MRLKQLFLFASLLLCLCSQTIPAYAEGALGQTLQINTNFSSIKGNPTWLLIVRDSQTGTVIPYLFDIRNNQNYWVAFTYGRSYQVTASRMQFNAKKTINNFCNLENGVLSGKSMFITLSGKLTTNRDTSKCSVLKYSNQ